MYLATKLLHAVAQLVIIVHCSPRIQMPSQHHQRKRADGSCAIDHSTQSRQFSEWSLNGDTASNHLALIQPPNMEVLNLQLDQLQLQPVLLGDKNMSNCQNVPIGRATNGPISLMETALCPWYWRINYDPLRIPSAIPEAHCRCSSSVTGERLFACEEVSIRLRVMLFNAECAELRPSTIEIAVSCVSVLQPTQRLASIDGVRREHNPANPMNEVK